MNFNGPHYTPDKTGATFFVIVEKETKRVYFSKINEVWDLTSWDPDISEEDANSLKDYLS